MGQKVPTRQEALELLHQYNEGDSLRKHAYAVEGVMRHIARKRGEDEENGGSSVLSMISTTKSFRINTAPRPGKSSGSAGGRRNISGAVSHGWGRCLDIMPQTDLEKTLYAIDELTGSLLQQP